MIVAGIGCRRLCPSGDIVAVVRAAEKRAGCRVTALAIPAFKANQPELAEAAATLGLPMTLVADAAMADAQPRCVTSSARAAAETGFASVAEAAALAASGPTGRLCLPRITHGAATCALAESAPA